MAQNLAVILEIVCFMDNLVSHQPGMSEVCVYHVSPMIYLVPQWHCQTSPKIYRNFAFKLGGGRWLLDLAMWLLICLKILALKLSLCQIEIKPKQNKKSPKKTKKPTVLWPGKVCVCTPLSQDYVIFTLYTGSVWCGERRAHKGQLGLSKRATLTALAPTCVLKKRTGIGI